MVLRRSSVISLIVFPPCQRARARPTCGSLRWTSAAVSAAASGKRFPPIGGREACTDAVSRGSRLDVLRIGEVSRLTGVSESTLRMWERRYGLVAPRRLANGYRVYAPDDVERVLAMRRALARGVGAAEAAAAAMSTARGAAGAP